MKKFFIALCTLMLFISGAYAKDFKFIQVSDVRYSINDENVAFKNMIEAINKQKNVEFVVFTGDNIIKADKSNLEGFIKEAKKLKMPFYIVLGDRDVNKYKDLSKKQYCSFLKKHIHNYKSENPNYIFEKKGWLFIVADGSKDVIPGTAGYYKDDVIEWIDKTLESNNGKNAIIFQHFPVVHPETREFYLTYKAEEYKNMLEKHSNVKAVITGHFDVNKEENVNGILHISTSKPPVYRIIDIIDYDTKNPSIWAQIAQ